MWLGLTLDRCLVCVLIWLCSNDFSMNWIIHFWHTFIWLLSKSMGLAKSIGIPMLWHFWLLLKNGQPDSLETCWVCASGGSLPKFFPMVMVQQCLKSSKKFTGQQGQCLIVSAVPAPRLKVLPKCRVLFNQLSFSIMDCENIIMTGILSFIWTALHSGQCIKDDDLLNIIELLF